MSKYIHLISGGKYHGSSNRVKFKDIEITTPRYKSIPELCKGKKVIDIGCAGVVETLELDLDRVIREGKHQFTNINKLAKECIGIDINQDAINVLNSKGYNVICLDVINSNHEIMDEEFDILVLSHVLEHVPNTHTFLKSIIDKFKFKEIIIGVPNAYSRTLLSSVLLQNEETISDDHYYTFTPVTLIMFCKSVGIEVEKLYFDIEEIPLRLGSNRKILGLLNSIVKKMLFPSKGDLIAVAKKIH